MQDYKLSFIPILAILMAICGCEKEKTIPIIKDDKEITTIAGTWKVVSYDDFDHNIQITKSTSNTWLEINSGDVIITFMDTLSVGHFSGRTVTNGVGGTYTITAPRKINIVDFQGDFAGQPEWADIFWESLPKAEVFSVNMTQLRIFYNTKRNSITFEKI